MNHRSIPMAPPPWPPGHLADEPTQDPSFWAYRIATMLEAFLQRPSVATRQALNKWLDDYALAVCHCKVEPRGITVH